MESVEGGASRGTRWVAWLSSPSLIDGDTSDDDNDIDGLVSAASDSRGREVGGIPNDDVTKATAAAGDESNSSTHNQL